MRRSRYSLVVLLLLALGLGFGCGDDNGTKPGSNTDPEITQLTAEFPVVQAGDTVAVSCAATDPDGDALSYSWDCSAGSVAGDGPQAVWTAPDVDVLGTISVTVADGHGGDAVKGVDVQSVAGTLLAQTRDGLVAADFTGGSHLMNEMTSKVEVLGTRIFQMGHPRIYEIDYQGEIINTITCTGGDVEGHNFFMLPDGGFVFITNWDDMMYFMDASGVLQHSDAMPDSNYSDLQSIYGRVVDNRLIVSETGTRKLVAVDLETYETSIFREFPDRGWLGAIHYNEGTYYLAGGVLIRKFTETGEPEDVCQVENGNWTGLTWAGGYLWGVINFEGKLCRIDPNSGEVVTILEGLDYPQDVEFLPAVVEEPGQP